MANLTLVIDDDTLRAARIRALEQGTSVNALVRDYLQRYTGRDTAHDAIAAFLAETETTSAGSGPAGRTWVRDDIYEERLDRRRP